MAMYSKKIKIDDIICGIIMRGVSNGIYECTFEREFASIEQIEAINWAQPTITGGKTILPEGYGFELQEIKYISSTKSYVAIIATQKQYLGDVVDMVSRNEELQATISEKNQTIAEQASQLASKEEELAAKNEQIELLSTANTELNEQIIQLANQNAKAE